MMTGCRCFDPYDPESIMHYPIPKDNVYRRSQKRKEQVPRIVSYSQLRLITNIFSQFMPTFKFTYAIKALNALYLSSSYLPTLRKEFKENER